ncbi:hypothetical protein FQA47_001415 [Oryzias melastigma]|uniref:Uncharacterized protein n=1 Tax=Oryzias melastigma TaxID=30732 RepID=A0A834L2J0_ORYME|nr:hypothetical protein FQA47_001415 [Oryzias melastigma]
MRSSLCGAAACQKKQKARQLRVSVAVLAVGFEKPSSCPPIRQSSRPLLQLRGPDGSFWSITVDPITWIPNGTEVPVAMDTADERAAV